MSKQNGVSENRTKTICIMPATLSFTAQNFIAKHMAEERQLAMMKLIYDMMMETLKSLIYP